MFVNNETINIFEENTSPAPVFMRTDIQEKDGSYLLEIELPGFLRDDIQAELIDGKLTIIARKPEHIDKDGNHIRYIRKERSTGSFTRSFYVGTNIRQEDISAAFKDGILSIIVANPDKAVDREERKLIPIK